MNVSQLQSQLAINSKSIRWLEDSGRNALLYIKSAKVEGSTKHSYMKVISAQKKRIAALAKLQKALKKDLDARYKWHRKLVELCNG